MNTKYINVFTFSFFHLFYNLCINNSKSVLQIILFQTRKHQQQLIPIWNNSLSLDVFTHNYLISDFNLQLNEIMRQKVLRIKLVPNNIWIDTCPPPPSWSIWRNDCDTLNSTTLTICTMNKMRFGNVFVAIPSFSQLINHSLFPCKLCLLVGRAFIFDCSNQTFWLDALISQWSSCLMTARWFYSAQISVACFS